MRSAQLAVWAAVLFPMAIHAQQVTPPGAAKEIDKIGSSDKKNGKTLNEWKDDLKSADPSIRLRAVATLKAYDKMAQDATPQLLKALTDKDASTRVNACITLGMIGYNQRDKNNVITAITTLLNDPQGIVRYQAAIALSKFGTDANFAVPSLARLTKDTISWEIRAAACTALATTGVTTTAGIDPDAWLALINALKDPCYEVKFAAMQSLVYMGKPALPTDTALELAALQSHYNDRNEVIAIWAHLCVMRIDVITEEHLNAIARHLTSPKAEARAEACKAFAIVGPAAAGKTPDAKPKNTDKVARETNARNNKLIRCLEDKDSVTAIWASAAVSQMILKTAIPKLRTVATTYPDEAVRLAATQALSRLGGEDKKGENRLVSSNTQELERRRAAEQVNGKTLNDWLVDLRNADPSVKLKAIANIKGFGERAQVATGQLRAALNDRDASARVNACISLAAIGINEKQKADVIDALIPRLNDSQGTVRYQAATTLGAMGPAAAAAVPGLVKLSKDLMTWEIRSVACTALATTGTQPGKGIDGRAWEALLDALKDPCFEVKFAALKGLLYMGKPMSAADTAKESTILQSHFTDKNEIIAIWAPLCYMRVNGVSEAQLPAIIKHLRSPKAEVRAEACRAFAIMGQEAKSAAKDLTDCLDDKDATTVIWDIAALSQMREAAQIALPKLKSLSTTHPDDSIRKAAGEAVKRLETEIKASK
jgi:HEAT repeat protein